MATGRSLRILIVEDEVLIALELEGLLQDAGHEVVGFATSSLEAVGRATELRPDLALVDIHLRDGPTGVEVARRLAMELDVAVLFMTANVKRIPSDFAGARGVLAKPYTERGVREALSYILSEGDPDAVRTASFIPFAACPRVDNLLQA